MWLLILTQLIKSAASRSKSSRVLYETYRQKTGPPAPEVSANIGFIGDGNMAKAICRSIVHKGVVNPSQVHVSSPFTKNLEKWKDLSANITTNNGQVAQNSDIIFIAVKPYMLLPVIQELEKSTNQYAIKNKLFVSILAGVTIETLEKALSVFTGSRVVRAMPNTPMMVGEGCTLFCPGTTATQEDIKLLENILSVSGLCQKVPENMINPAGSISGCGPAFIYLVIEALSDGAVKVGLPREMATRFAAQTVLGAAKMVLESGKHTGQLKDQVCSAGGTTIAGIHEMEKGAVRGSIMNAVEAAAKKSSELGE